MAKMKVVSQVMSSGKSSGFANLINTDPEYNGRNIIYIAPFLSECKRFKNACNKNFVEPLNWDEYGGSKLAHITQLLSEQRSISSTHAAFMRYDDKILSLIREGEYILVMDETCAIMEECTWNYEDIWLLEKAGLIQKDGQIYRFNEDEAHYIEKNGSLSEICEKARFMDLYSFSDDDNGKFFYYTMPPAVLESFSEIFVLTYMWECSDLYMMVNSIGMDWEYAYVTRVDYGNGYMITSEKPDVPEYVLNIPKLLHIYERPDAGKTGRPRKDLNRWKCDKKGYEEYLPYKLSVSFFSNSKNKPIVTELRNSIRTYFRNVMAEHGGKKSECMWSTYKDFMEDLYSDKNAWMEDQFVSFNERAKNDYAHCKYIAYAVDIYPTPMKKIWYKKNGMEYPEDQVALSTMVQFLWRGAIRRQEEIYAFIPSERMRNLLKEWLCALSEGEGWCEI